MGKYFKINNKLRTKNSLISFSVLIIGFIITFVLAFAANRNIKKHIHQELELSAIDLSGKIQNRLNAHVQFSRSSASYCMSSDTITKLEWKQYVEKSKITESLKGFQGIALITNVPKNQLNNHIQHYRKGLSDDYTIKPIETDFYSPIVYIEPLIGKNFKALGYNISSNSLMRKSIEEARDLNKSVLTDKVTLIQEEETGVQPGIVIYSPIYKSGYSINSIEERRKAIKGWVGSSFRMNDLMEGVLNKSSGQGHLPLHIKIYDGDKISSESILYDNSSKFSEKSIGLSQNTLVLPIDLNGKKWTLIFENPRINSSFGGMYFVVICGIIISMLLSFLIFSLLNTFSFAQRMAKKLTIQLVEKNKENKKLSSAVEQSSNIIIITDTESKIEYTNPKFTEISGYSAKEVLGLDPSFLSPINYDYVLDEISEKVSAGKEWKGQFKNYTKDGTVFWLQTTIKALKNEFGEFTNLLMISEDITKSKIIEQKLILANQQIEEKNKELIKARDKAEESNRLKSAFLANMSHEIRTPMNGILGFSELLKQPNLTGEKQSKYIEIIEKSGARMLNVINDIVNISKIESGQMEVVISEININDQLEEISSFFKPEAKKKGLKLTVNNNLSIEDAFIKSDSHKIYGILANFVKNAIKYCEQGTIELGVIKSDTKFLFSVKDSGIGIPIDRQKAIFDRFVQADILDVNALHGAGLGLAISKAYAEMLDGKIWVESEEGIGSAFYFEVSNSKVPETVV